MCKLNSAGLCLVMSVYSGSVLLWLGEPLKLIFLFSFTTNLLNFTNSVVDLVLLTVQLYARIFKLLLNMAG